MQRFIEIKLWSRFKAVLFFIIEKKAAVVAYALAICAYTVV